MNLAKLTDGKDEVIFSVVIEEEDNRDNEITDNPMEDGSIVSDHIINRPIIWNVKGAMVKRPESEVAYQQLTRFWREKKLLKYTGRVAMGNIQIQNLTTRRDKNIADGFEFTLTLKQIKMAKKEEIKINTQKLDIPDIETLKMQLQEEQAAKRTKLQSKTKAGKKGKKKGKESQLDKILRMY